MNKKQARKVALELAASIIRHELDAGACVGETDSDDDNQKIADQMNLVIEKLEQQAERISVA